MELQAGEEEPGTGTETRPKESAQLTFFLSRTCNAGQSLRRFTSNKIPLNTACCGDVRTNVSRKRFLQYKIMTYLSLRLGDMRLGDVCTA